MELSELKAVYAKRKSKALEDFFTFLRFASISSEAGSEGQLLACAGWLEELLRGMGFKTEMWPTVGHPVLFASYMAAGPDKPTILIYNHYDVQPVDPLELWQSQPFEPEVRDGQVYARGAQDNKGQCFYVLQALKVMIEETGSLPINVKLCIEGEEEIGSAGLSSILDERKDALQADYVAIVDLGIPGPDVPSLTLGIRGIVTMDMEVRGSGTDMHSGSNGGIVYNPLHALVELLASLRDADGKIAVPGFYDQVNEIRAEERAQVCFDFDESAYAKTFGAKASGGEKKLGVLERAWLRPTLEINGIGGGYAGSGFKTVIPAKATAKLSCRVVPDQDPEKTARLVADFLESKAPEGVDVKVTVREGWGTALRASSSSPVAQAFAQAFTEVFEKPCRFVLEGASIPITTELAQACGGDVVMLGLGLASDQIHAPNEHFGLDRLEKGFLIICRALQLLTHRDG